MFSLMLAAAVLAAPVPATPEGKAVEAVAYTGHFEKNNSGLKGDASHLVFTTADGFGKIFGTLLPMRVVGNRARPLDADVFEKSLVVAAITRGTSVATYSDVSTKLAGTTLTVSYKSTLAAPTTANFASPLILGVPKDGIKSVVFVANGKESAPINVK